MTSARIVACGHAMAMIPTTTARMPSRIIEVEVDLIDLSIGGIPSASDRHTRSIRVLGAGRYQQTPRRPRPTNICRLWMYSCQLGNRPGAVQDRRGTQVIAAGGAAHRSTG